MAHVLLADFSMTDFCAAVARAAPDPPQRGRVSTIKGKQPHGDPEAHRLFSLRLEPISAGIANRAASCVNTGAKCSPSPWSVLSSTVSWSIPVKAFRMLLPWAHCHNLELMFGATDKWISPAGAPSRQTFAL